MEFRKFMLEDYLNGHAGQDCWEFFSHFAKEFEERDCGSRFYQFVTERVNGEGYAGAAFGRSSAFSYDGDAEFTGFDDFYDDMSASFADSDLARTMQSWVPYISVQLFLRYPEYAVPYLIPRHFYKLEIICREFGISIPNLPSKNNHVARFNYYFELCRALYEFRKRCDMSPVELCVFLYGYAMRFVDDIIQNRVCRNSLIFVVLANPETDGEYLSKERSPDEVTIWQGKPEMIPGDIVLMYERSPRSCFSSVWRAVTPGFDDPFDENSGKVFLGECVKIPDLPFKEFSKAPVLSENSLVAAHMQNGCGRTFSPEEYSVLIDLAKRKDPTLDIGGLPPVPKSADYDQEGLLVEHDVELKLLEPLLRQLGFASDDWVTQYIMRIGRENTSRPDYVIYLDESGSTPTAKYVFEAKLSIPTRRQLKKDHGQAVTYGNLLQSESVALVAREGVWVSKRADRFGFDKVDFFSLEKLKDAETFSKLRQVFHTYN